ncbi:hypothetical protein BDF21DRAFT_433954 [Thamnidium elegans]|uniref:Myb-like domain-containing protein n=1 Tax=Thamnidium elegans TaxID=101142 RepID=A0A8H7SRD1_9FUNG|nr:hypothetical protein INT48_004915 [Thamnidium elegans]KAI8047780.1 hypothetical protein BDF21DRAFT_433954 [Thamnidium elegans]
MSEFTTESQENSAIQGLLALRDCDSGGNKSPQSDSNSILTTPELHPNTKPNLVLQSNYCMSPPLESSIDPRFNQEINRVPNLSYVSSQSMKSPSENEHATQAYYQDFNCVNRRPSNQLIYYPQQSQQKVTLPPIKDMIAQFPLSHHQRRSTNILSPRGSVSDRHARAIATHPYQRKSSVISLKLLKQHSKLQKSTHGLSNVPPSLQDHRNYTYQNEPDSFFNDLKQQYPPEFENELREQENQSNTDSVETQYMETESDDIDEIDEDDKDDGSVYKPTRPKKVVSESKRSRHSEKPRWTTKEKRELFEAIVRHKTLDIMATFDWNAIGADIGRVDKACKDQWRRGILKMFREYICKL